MRLSILTGNFASAITIWPLYLYRINDLPRIPILVNQKNSSKTTIGNVALVFYIVYTMDYTKSYEWNEFQSSYFLTYVLKKHAYERICYLSNEKLTIGGVCKYSIYNSYCHFLS